jgi:hypothetical protein
MRKRLLQYLFYPFVQFHVATVPFIDSH